MSVVSEIAMVPDRELETPTLIVSVSGEGAVESGGRQHAGSQGALEQAPAIHCDFPSCCVRQPVNNVLNLSCLWRLSGELCNATYVI